MHMLTAKTENHVYHKKFKYLNSWVCAISADPDQTAPEEQGLYCLPFPLHLFLMLCITTFVLTKLCHFMTNEIIILGVPMCRIIMVSIFLSVQLNSEL